VIQSDQLVALATLLIAPTSTSAAPASFRPIVEIDGRSTRVLVEQARVVDPRRLGEVVGALDHAELCAVDEALRLVLDL
jgi:mRNA interferase MazF